MECKCSSMRLVVRVASIASLLAGLIILSLSHALYVNEKESAVQSRYEESGCVMALDAAGGGCILMFVVLNIVAPFVKR